MSITYTAEQALDAMRSALAELADAEAGFEAGRAQFGRRHPLVHPDDANRLANAITDWQTAHTRIQSYAAVATALLLAERWPSPAQEGLPCGGAR